MQSNVAIAAMEEQLDLAFREIGRLKHELSATPNRNLSLEVMSTKIKALEREKAALQERLVEPDFTSDAVVSNTMKTAGSPFYRSNPIMPKTIASLRTPKTPGPLKDVSDSTIHDVVLCNPSQISWLQTTISSQTEPVLRAHLDHLRDELEVANGQLDRNFSRLEVAGLSGIALAEKLATAENRIFELEDEIRCLLRKDRISLIALSEMHKEQE